MARAYGVLPSELLALSPHDLTVCWWTYCEGRQEIAENAGRGGGDGWSAVIQTLFALLDR